ncbi:hypothetical protein LPJ77_002394 [Coemansia sp. RSA 2523]|nr:hypothetical protein LPJ58_002727 [Coemansia sp. RSA 1591]KAJ1762768.1 hypothetical protein LPJ69_002682 [Coemansia sp. RSA 1752]KAJ1778114.1 hypothetical protein LPJ54_001930 [Coemansia sp. RSA 1824]KAJ1808372.1 hypothetical protein LPJ77_002394 [Coemansia sp. RSA 2523]KAJ2139370.1 hypothetical protein GGH17_000556 [Coemansia sp. RSA 788]KAJ2146848.1 hypothetical protein IW142_001877 [Coemansia sp. RSA 564]KAJ2170391.1 hypothetical protein GGH16_003392 [Coemansia sp. RSA 560]KAJ2191698.1
MDGMSGPTAKNADSTSANMTDQRPETPTGRIPSRSEIQSDKSLAEFLVQMDNYAPIIPEALTDYYLAQAGFECNDVRIKRLLALATQKFISDVATDAYQYSRIRQQASKEKKYHNKDRKTVLNMDDLTAALGEYGVNIKKPEYFS